MANETEPVAWLIHGGEVATTDEREGRRWEGTPLYAHPLSTPSGEDVRTVVCPFCEAEFVDPTLHDANVEIHRLIRERDRISRLHAESQREIDRLLAALAAQGQQTGDSK